MKRALTLIVIVGVLVLGIGAGVYLLRLRAKVMTPSHAATTGPAMPEKRSLPGMPRGPVSPF